MGLQACGSCSDTVCAWHAAPACLWFWLSLLRLPALAKKEQGPNPSLSLLLHAYCQPRSGPSEPRRNSPRRNQVHAVWCPLSSVQWLAQRVPTRQNEAHCRCKRGLLQLLRCATASVLPGTRYQQCHTSYMHTHKQVPSRFFFWVRHGWKRILPNMMLVGIL